MKDVFTSRNLVKKDASNAILQLRREKNITQRELADILGISVSSICLYEQGKRFPTLKVCQKICDYFNCDINFLYGLSETKNTSLIVKADNKDIAVYSRKKLIDNGNALSLTDKAIFDSNHILYSIVLPKSMFAKNKSYFGIIAFEDTLRGYGIEPDDLCIFSEANAEDVNNNKVVCALIAGKIVIRKLVKEDDSCYYLFNGNDDDKPIKIPNSNKEFIVGQLAVVISNKQ